MRSVWEEQHQINYTRPILLTELRQALVQMFEEEGYTQDFLNKEWHRFILERILVCQPYRPNEIGNTDILKSRVNNINGSAGSAQATGAVGQLNEQISGVINQNEGIKEIYSKEQT